MKTSLTLSILGAYNTLMGILMLCFPDKMAITMIGDNRANANPDLEQMATMFHYGLAPALLMIGLILIMIRTCDMETAKKSLLAYVIATVVLLTLFFTVFSESTVMDFSIEMAAPDMLALSLALFGFFKAK
tara:strand:+ start:184 stop:576 length:393 start_codon:yes stop_codon:yes gene_type:complete